MRLGTRLIAGFLIVALVLVVVASASILLEQQAESAQDKADDEIEELNEINELQSGLYEEHTMAIKYLTTDDPTEAAAILDEKEEQCEENEEAFDELAAEFEEEGEYTDVIDDIQVHMDDLDEAFGSASDAKESGELGEAAWISALDDEYNYMIEGDDANDTIGFDYMASILDENIFELENLSWVVEFNYVEPMYTVSQLMYDAQMAAILAISTGNATWMNENATTFAMNTATAQGINEMLVAALIPMQLDPTQNFEGLEGMIYSFYAANDTITAMSGVFNQYLAMPGQNQTENIASLNNLFTAFNTIYDALIQGGEDIMDEWNEQIILDMAERSDLNVLMNGLSKEYSLGVRYLMEPDPTQAEDILEDKEEVCEANEDLIENLTARFQSRNDFFLFAGNTELHARLIGALNHTTEGMENSDDVIQDASLKKEAGAMALASSINDIDELLEECMVGEGSNDREGFDYLTASIGDEVEASQEDANEARGLATTITMVGVVMALVVALILGIVTSRTISKPVVGMTDAARQVKEGNLNVSVDTRGSDEIAELGDAFNQMVQCVRLIADATDMEGSGMDGPGIQPPEFT
jgi:HAMP domain-containing protein